MRFYERDMIFHTPDRSYRRLASCWKRAARYAAPGAIPSAHGLAAAWGNARMMIDAKDAGDEAAGDFTDDLIFLDWFASRLDVWAESHQMDGDPVVAAILHEWRARMPFDPCGLVSKTAVRAVA